jgi:hypothetical protein
VTLASVATIECTDAATGDDAVVIVRAVPDRVALCLSLRHDGDTEVCFSGVDAEQILAALEIAVARARSRAV